MKKILLFLLSALFLGYTPAFCAETSLDEMIGQMIILGFNGNSTLSKGFREVSNDLKEGRISGVIFFAAYAEGSGMPPVLYSFCYNGSYMAAEGVITLIIISIPAVSKAIAQVKRGILG